MTKLVMRLFWRDVRAGEWTVLALALVLAVAAVTSIGFVTGRIERVLQQEATRLLAADAVLIGDTPVRARHFQVLEALNLKFADTVTFPSMAFARGEAQLATLKAVSVGYPLRGDVAILQNGEVRQGQFAPEVGTVWADERLLSRLKLREGDQVQLGQAYFRVAATLVSEPDGTIDVYSFVPRVMLNLADLERTGLIQEGSRVRYRLLMAGGAAEIDRAERILKPRLVRGERLENVTDARPEIRVGLDRARRFLGLTSLLAIVLAVVALALASRRYLARHYASVATLRCFGATQKTILGLFLGQFAVLGGLSGVLGAVLGWLAQHALLWPFAEMLGADGLPSAGVMPWLLGVVSGYVLLFGFCVPALLQLRHVPVMTVFRQEVTPDKAGALAYVMGVSSLGGLMWWQVRDVTLTGVVAGGFLGFAVLAAVLAWLGWLGLNRVGRWLPVHWRYGIAHAVRRSSLSVMQTVVLASGIMVLLTLVVVRGDLLQAWQRSVPSDAPNRFVLNIQPEQRDAVADALVRQGLSEPKLAPMIRGRLVAINERQVKPNEDYSDERTRQLAEREFNLSWAQDVPQGNRVVSGAWWSAEGKPTPQFSVERDIAQRLGISVGDTLLFQIAGNEYRARVSNLREVDWDSFRVNFFVIASPEVLSELPSSWITSVHVPQGEEAAVSELVREFPNLTVIDVSSVLNEVQNLMMKLVWAIQIIFGFGMLAGVLVLWAAIHATRGERLHEAAVLRLLGVPHGVLFKMNRAELIALGALSGSLGALGAMGLAVWIGRGVLDLPLVLNFGLLPLGIVGGVLVTWCVGAPVVWRVARASPLAALNHYAQ